jgi:hypothetical protein
MQALRLPPEDDEVLLLVGLEFVGCSEAVLELGLPQPAMSRLAAPSAATILTGWRKRLSSSVPHRLAREMFGSP